MSEEVRWCVVTGGRGFLARNLVDVLLQYKIYSVRIVDLDPTISLSAEEENGVLASALSSGHASYVSCDLRNKAQFLKVVEGAEVVFHMAAPDSSVKSRMLQYSVNVEGTRNVVDVCVTAKVKRLIYTSSASVVFNGARGIVNGDETLPYAHPPLDSYSETKAVAEAEILKANGNSGLLTCSLRASGIFGPGDKLFVPTLVAAARAGRSKFIIGDGNNVMDFTYVENVSHAHICAERALASEKETSEKAAGQAYFITNMEPIKFWEFSSLIWDGLGYERPRIKIPVSIMMPISHVVERAYMLLGPYGMKVPQLLPSRIRILSCSRTFNCSKAKDRLGYAPVVSLEEGLKRTLESYSHLRAENQPKREGPSKASIFLGGGRVADTLLWKDRKQTLMALLILIGIYYSFIAPQTTIITAVSKLLMVATVFLVIHGILPEKMFGYTIEKIPASFFHLSDEHAHLVARSVASSWNDVANVLKSLCTGDDWTLFLKVALWLSILSFVGAISLTSFFLIGIPIGFAAFALYEKNEDAIDDLVSKALSSGCKLKSDVLKKVVSFKKIEDRHSNS